MNYLDEGQTAITMQHGMKKGQKAHCADPSTFVKHIYVAENCLQLPMTQKILSRAATIPQTVLRDDETPPPLAHDFPKNLAKGKRTLFLCRNRGRFLKPCPATREYRCCDYHVLHIGMNCPMDCTYCILQAYMNNPWLSFYVNVEDLLAELEEQRQQNPSQLLRIGTGEFTDSMALDRLTGLSSVLVEYFGAAPSMVLELKTKSTAVDSLEGLRHNGKTVVSWSLNSATINRSEELHTASLDMRLHAAVRCAAWGYKLAFHFDPLVVHENWQQEYTETVRRLFDTVPARHIAWISLGALRFLPPLKAIVRQRFPGSSLFCQEFITGLDNKCRYFRSQRIELYQLLLQELKRHAAPGTCIYLCMESDEIWRDVFGYTPESKGGLRTMLDEAARTGKFCGLI